MDLNDTDYSALRAFWNEQYAALTPEPADESRIDDAVLRDVIARCVPEGGDVLDYGCGTGWMLFEIARSKEIRSGMGIDAAEHAISFAAQSAALSGLSHLSFLCGDEALLASYPGCFDFAVTVNTLDVLPEDVILRILSALHSSLKPGAYLIVCMNPHFTLEQMTDLLHMEPRGRFYYKDGILRYHHKERAEWESLFSRWFDVLKYHTFAISEKELRFPRQMYVLRRR